VLLAAGRFPEAEAAYREDLTRFPDNGWSLFGLHQALAAQRRTSEAAVVRARFATAWERADVTLTSSRIIDEEPTAASDATPANGATADQLLHDVHAH
jgi:hypothetical protein